ncbi:MAG: hypothetical protein ACK4PC_00620 [Sphingopyxis sp.]
MPLMKAVLAMKADAFGPTGFICLIDAVMPPTPYAGPDGCAPSPLHPDPIPLRAPSLVRTSGAGPRRAA